jgi:dienelactone hydrolase
MKIEASPLQSLIDAPVALRVSDAAPGQEITIRARVGDTFWRWESHATFAADSKGSVDTARSSALRGTYEGVDQMGLHWSMRLNPATRELMLSGRTTPTPWDVREPVTVAITAETNSEVADSVALIRGVMAPGLIRTPIRDDGLVGTLFQHEGGARASVMVLGGSDGGLNEAQPALLASHGYDVLALAYFGLEGLPSGLCEVPLEYFEKAIALMQRRNPRNADRIGVMGASRGGELALLLGATFPQIRAVVGYVPSGVMWGGLTRDQGAPPSSAWTWRGKPLPFVPQRPAAEPQTGPPDAAISFTPSFLASLKDREAVEAATIPVERTSGPVLMISGDDDRLWPSATLSELACERFAGRNFRHSYRHLRNPGAGHYFRFPYMPTTVREMLHPVVPMRIAFGGNPRDDAAAARRSWDATLEFFAEHLR